MSKLYRRKMDNQVRSIYTFETPALVKLTHRMMLVLFYQSFYLIHAMIKLMLFMCVLLNIFLRPSF